MILKILKRQSDITKTAIFAHLFIKKAININNEKY